jgi:hypothetical protein
MLNGQKYQWVGYMGLAALGGLIGLSVLSCFRWPAEAGMVNTTAGVCSNVVSLVIGALIGAARPDEKGAPQPAAPTAATHAEAPPSS